MELDAEGLARLNAWAEGRIAAADRRARMRPLMEAMNRTLEETMSRTVPDLMVAPEAQVRRSVTSMERSVANFPATLAEVQREHDERLARARRRTALLREWLEAIG